ncbi:MAG: oxygen-dependent coproporphyrinogen oxidase, partial [Asticcacaulis sp.]
MTSPAPIADSAPDSLAARRQQAAQWFRTLRDRICAAFEALEDDAPKALYGPTAGRFERTPWDRPEGGGGEM